MGWLFLILLDTFSLISWNSRHLYWSRTESMDTFEKAVLFLLTLSNLLDSCQKFSMILNTLYPNTKAPLVWYYMFFTLWVAQLHCSKQQKAWHLRRKTQKTVASLFPFPVNFNNPPLSPNNLGLLLNNAIKRVQLSLLKLPSDSILHEVNKAWLSWKMSPFSCHLQLFLRFYQKKSFFSLTFCTFVRI